MYRALKTYNTIFLVINLLGSIGGATILWINGNFWMGLVSLVGGLFWTFFLAVFLGTIAENGENIEALMSRQIETERKVESVSAAHAATRAGSDEWLCNFCGRINKNYTGTCACGHSKWENGASASSGSPKIKRAGANEWKCRFCGRINQNYTGTCACGHTKEESKGLA